MTDKDGSAEGRFAALGSPGPQVRPQKMADMVANRIRGIIARGELQDGEWLPTESELMGQLGVSRPTLREAFRLLEADSLVTIRRGPPGGARGYASGHSRHRIAFRGNGPTGALRGRRGARARGGGRRPRRRRRKPADRRRLAHAGGHRR